MKSACIEKIVANKEISFNLKTLLNIRRSTIASFLVKEASAKTKSESEWKPTKKRSKKVKISHMLCSKCYSDIPQGKEIQIKGSIICQKCALDSSAKKEAVGRCNQCFKLIYKGEIIHEVYENWGVENSEKLMKCQQCYNKWLETAELRRKKWELTKWSDNFFQFSMWFVLAAITINKNKEHAGWGLILLMFSLSTYYILLSPPFFNFVLFVYQKVLERKYRKNRKKRRKLEQEIAKLTKKLQEKAILVVKDYWKSNQGKNGKVNERTITEILGENWEKGLKEKKEKEDILMEKNRLIKKIDDELKLAK